MAQGPLQVWPPVTINRIVQTAIYRLAMHPLLIDPPIIDATGNPLRINKFRNFDGKELTNTTGITLSVFPYHYASADADTSLTVQTENAALVYNSKEMTLGGPKGDTTSYIKARASIQFKLHIFGYSKNNEDDPGIIQGQDTLFEHNYLEWTLRQYAEVIAAILRDDLHYLPGFPNKTIRLLANSFVHHIDFPTAAVDSSSNLILHSATLTWHADYYVPIRWRRLGRYIPVELSDGNIPIGYIVDSTGVSHDVFYDTIRRVFLLVDGTIIDRSQLNNPATQTAYSSLDRDLLTLIDTAPKSLFDLSFYFVREDDQLC